MGSANPWSPNWRPDPTGRRAIAIRASRRGAVLAALLLWPLTLAATLTTPGVEQARLVWPILAAALSWPGLALLGAGLAPTTLGSRVDATVAGIALAVGAPVAAVTSVAIGAAIVALYPGTAGVGESMGMAIRLGVLGANRVSPLLGLAVVAWVAIVRRSIGPFEPLPTPPVGSG